MNNQYRIIIWNEYPAFIKIIPQPLKRLFENYFNGHYHMSSGIIQSIIDLNGFLKSLNGQQLDIFLSIKGSISGNRDKTKDLFFVDILLQSLETAYFRSKPIILDNLLYIAKKNMSSREILINKNKLIQTQFDCDDNSIKSKALELLTLLESDFKPLQKSQYFFKNNNQFDFYITFRDIILRSNTFIKIWDNFADFTLFDYFNIHPKITNIKEIKIICGSKNHEQLKFSKNKFLLQYTDITIEIKTTNISHDRFILTDNENWHLGPSIKDGGNKACVISEMIKNEANEITTFFNETWQISRSI